MINWVCIVKTDRNLVDKNSVHKILTKFEQNWLLKLSLQTLNKTDRDLDNSFFIILVHERPRNEKNKTKQQY